MSDTGSDPGLYSALSDNANQAIIIRDGSQLVECNQAACNLWKYPDCNSFLNNEAVNLSPSLQPDGHSSLVLDQKHVASAHRQGGCHVKWRFRDREGRDFDAHVTYVPVVRNGQHLLYLGITPMAMEDQTDTASRPAQARYKSLFDNTPDGIVIVDAHDRVIEINHGFMRMFGYGHDELAGQVLDDCIIPDALLDESHSLTTRVLYDARSPTVDTIRKHRDGTEIRVNITGLTVLLDDGSEGVCCIYRNIEREWQAAERIRTSKARLRAVIGNAPIILFALDNDGRFTLSDGQALSIIGLQPGELDGQTIFDVFANQPEVLAEARRALAVRSRKAQLRISGAIFELKYVAAYDRHGEPDGVIGVAYDVTEAQLARQRLVHLAQHDVLTGLPNRALFRERLESVIERTHRKHSHAALLFVDLNHFKSINDSLGHAVGDRVLKIISQRLAGVMRQSDTVARLGGDEFAILVESLQSPEDAAQVAEQLLAALHEPIVDEDIRLDVTASIGISLYPQDGDSVKTLLSRADTAMYEAKNSERKYCFFTRDMTRDMPESLMLGNEIKSALEQQQFEIHYQSVIDLRSHALTGFEALIRWRHPAYGLMKPGEFLHIAEQTGQAALLGNQVVRAACRQVQAWREQGYHVPRMAINLSAAQLHSHGFIDTVREILDETDLSDGTILFEINEAVLSPGSQTTRLTLKSLHNLGCDIAIDDFGTGASSLACLRNQAIRCVKIDGQFIQGIATDVDARQVILAIIAMGRILGVTVIAEAVETQAQLAFLRDNRCDEIQGYYLDRPMPPDEVEFFLTDEGRSHPRHFSVREGNPLDSEIM